MLKKITRHIIVVLAVLSIIFGGSGVYARENVLSTLDTSQTEQFLVSIARPLRDESTYKDIFKICGSAKIDNIRIRLYVRSENSGRYRLLKNSRGETYWDVGKSGVFVKEAVLPQKGVNIVRVCAYDKRQEHNLEIGRNLQVNEFSIISLNRSMQDKSRGNLFGMARHD